MPMQSVSLFEVAIGPGKVTGEFRVGVISSPAGEASAATSLDVVGLLARREELQRAVLASAVITRTLLPETERCVRDVGEELFSALLGSGDVAGRYRASTAVAAEREEELRIVLRIDDPILAVLPWEMMYDKSAGVYVCRRDQLVRHIPVASSSAPLTVDPPLRILGVVSAPRGLPTLDVEKEKAQLENALARTSKGMAQVEWAPSAKWGDLHDMLLGEKWHVLHFIGHGGFDPRRDEGVLALTSADGEPDLVEASRLVDLLRQARPMPRLVVLNACYGAAAGVTDLFSGTAAALVRAGVSAVAAMQYEISDPAAVAFARGFYRAITSGRGIDEAVSAGRVAIMGLSAQSLEWVTPVLYLRGHDSRLFAIAAVGVSPAVFPTEGTDGSPLPAQSDVDPSAAGGPDSHAQTMHVPASRLDGSEGLPFQVWPSDSGTSAQGTAAVQRLLPTTARSRLRTTRWVSAVGVAVAAIAVVVALILVTNSPHVPTGRPNHTSSPTSRQTGSTILAHVTSEATEISGSTLKTVGVGTAYLQAIMKVKGAPLTAGGKPELLYIGAGFCPYCAATQWSLVVALSRFGAFSNLQFSRSAPAPEEEPASIATLSFYGATYSSKYLVFTSVENEDVEDAPLQIPTPQEQAIWNKYDRHNYYPFIDVGNVYAFVPNNTFGALFSLYVLEGEDQQKIAASLSNPSSSIAEAVDGSANELIAAICSVTKGQPGSVCNSPTITAVRGDI